MTSFVTSGMNSLPSFTYENTILLDDGIYTNVNLTINNIGTLTNPIIIKAKNNGKVFFSGPVNVSITGQYIILSNIIFTNGNGSIQLKGSNNRITNCEFSLNDGDGPILTVHKYNNRIDHNVFKDFSNFNPWVQVVNEDDKPDHILIDSNLFMNRKKGEGNGFETIRFGLSGTSLSPSRSVIENNIFENCNGEIEIVSNKAGGNIYHKNTFKTSYGSLTLRHGNNVIVSKNKFLQNNTPDGGGIRVAAGSGHIIYNNLMKNTNGRAGLIINSGSNGDIYNIQVSYSKFLKNIFIDCSLDILIGSTQYPISPRLCSFNDNVIIKNNNDPVYQINSNMIDFDFHNNVYHATNMGNIPEFYKQEIDLSKNQFSIVESDYGALEETIYGGDIIFDNKYGDEYYKYLNKTIFDEINLNSEKFNSGKLNLEKFNYTQNNNPLLPSTGISLNYNVNPFMLLFLCVISFRNII
jgi:poly(beta-D-mannuronate) lyase